jgi:transcription elongation GreA/GreB family factor
MTAKVDEVLARIPSLKVKIEDVVDFKDKCVDPLAVEIITESLDYALETSVRRLESVAKINPTIRDTAVNTILPAVKTLRDVINDAPKCGSSALGTAPVAPTPKKSPRKPKEKKEIVETLTETVSKAKEKAKPTEKDIIIKQTPKIQEALANIKKTDAEMYQTIMTGMAEGKTALGAMQGKPAPTQKIGIGKQLTMTVDGEIFNYMMVSPEVAKIPEQVPEEKDVTKLSTESKLGKAIMGLKPGEKAKEKIEGKEITITRVKEGRMIKLGG